MLTSIQATPSSSRPRTACFPRRLAVIVSLGLLLVAWVPTAAAQQFQDGQTVEIVFDDFPTQDCGTSPEVKTIDTSPGAVEIPTGECFGLSVNVTSDAIVLSGQDNFTSGNSAATLTFKQGSASSAPNISGFESPSYQRTSGVKKNPTVSSFTSTEVSISEWDWQQSSGSDPDGNPEVATFTLATPNTAPTASGTISPTSLNDDAGPTALFDGIDVSDPDAGETDLALRVTVGNAAAGVISGVSGTTVTNEGGGVFSVNGSFDPSTIDTALDNLRFSPTDNTGSSGTFNTDITVQVDDQESGFVDVSGPTTVTVTRINDAPTVALGSTSGSIDENNSPPNVLTGITISDPDGGTNNLSLSGADAGAFNINGSNELEFTATADFETKSTYDVTVEVNDPNVGSDPNDSESFSLSITDVNEPPTVALGSTSGSINENNSPPNVLTGITINDDALGTNTLSLSGADAGAFNINGSDELEFTATADFESKNSYDVTVEVDDSNVGADPDDSESFSLSITDVNEPPTVASPISNVSVNEDAPDQTIDLASAFSDPEQAAGDLTFAVDNNTNTGLVSTSVDNSTDELTLSFTQDANGSATITVSATDDATQSVTDQFDVTVAAQNDAPTISPLSDQTIQEDGTLSSLSFTVDDPETSDLSTLSLSGSSGNTTLVPNSNISFTGPDNSGNAAITVNPAPNESGTATITVTVDDGAGSNNTASEQFTLTVNAVPDLTITDGSAGGLDVTSDVSPGTNDNPVGIFALSAGQSGASFDGVTVTNNAPGVSGISAARLYWSSDQTLDPNGGDTQLDEVTTDASSAPSTISFSGFSQSIETSTRYAILAIDVESGATADVSFELADDSDLSTPGGEIATVNGSSQSSFSALPLSNGSTALPVELATFEGALAEGGSAAKRAGSKTAVQLTWRTAGETNNAGFEVQRRATQGTNAGQVGTSAAGWKTVGFVESKAEGGTTDEATDYAFRDAVAFSADTLTYRLRQVDVGGGESFSEPITIARRAVGDMRLLPPYPNPTHGPATVQFAVPEDAEAGAATLRLYDVLGRRVRTIQLPTEGGRHKQTLRTDGLPSGTYVLRLQVGGASETQRLTVVQ